MKRRFDWRVLTNAVLLIGGSLLIYAVMVIVIPDPGIMGNERSHFRLLQSLVSYGGIEISYTASDVAIYEGRFLSNKPPGYPLVMWPFFHIWAWISELNSPEVRHFYFFSRLFNAFVSSLTGVFYYLYLRSFRISGESVLFGVVAASFGNFALVYATPATSIPFSVFLIVLGLLLFRIAELAEFKVRWQLVMVSAVLSTAFIVDYKSIAFVLPLAPYYGSRILRIGLGGGAAVILAAAVPLSVMAIYNFLAFGDPFTLSYQFYHAPEYVKWNGVSAAFSIDNFLPATWGLSFGLARGMFVLSPVTLMGIAGFYIGIRSGFSSLWLPLLMALSGFFTISFYEFWFGGNSVGYRHVIVTAVFFALASAFFFDCIEGKLTRLLCILVLCFSCFLASSAWLIQNDDYLREKTWTAESGESRQGNFFIELLSPCLSKADRCKWGWPN